MYYEIESVNNFTGEPVISTIKASGECEAIYKLLRELPHITIIKVKEVK